MTPFELGTLIMGVSGWAIVIYLIYKSRMDKPKLELELEEEESKYFYPAEGNNNFTTVVVRCKTHNKGTKATTIYYSRLDFKYNSEPMKITDDRSSTDVPVNSTVDYQPNLNLHKSDGILYDKITNCVLTIKHTHGKKVYNLGTIDEYKHEKD